MTTDLPFARYLHAGMPSEGTGHFDGASGEATGADRRVAGAAQAAGGDGCRGRRPAANRSPLAGCAQRRQHSKCPGQDDVGTTPTIHRRRMLGRGRSVRASQSEAKLDRRAARAVTPSPPLALRRHATCRLSTRGCSDERLASLVEPTPTHQSDCGKPNAIMTLADRGVSSVWAEG